jgi:hypothetical protein
MTTTILWLFFLFELKHFICDYPLQTEYMLGKFKPYPEYLTSLFAHSLVHGAGTFITIAIVSAFVRPVATFSYAFMWAVMDVVTHFIIDRVKASPDLGGRWKSDNKYFWWALGADQFGHHVVQLLIILALVR